MENYIEKIEQVRLNRSVYNLQIPEPIKEYSINSFKEKYKAFFGIKMDDESINFYKICDGLEDSGYKIYSSYNHTINKTEYGIFQNNELWYSDIEDFRNYVFYGESGMEFFVFNKEQEEYQCLDRYNTDNIIATFNSFNDMLLYILKLMLYEEVD